MVFSWFSHQLEFLVKPTFLPRFFPLKSMGYPWISIPASLGTWVGRKVGAVFGSHNGGTRKPPASVLRGSHDHGLFQHGHVQQENDFFIVWVSTLLDGENPVAS